MRMLRDAKLLRRAQVIMGGCLQLHLAPWQQVALARLHPSSAPPFTLLHSHLHSHLSSQVALTRLFALGPALAVAVGTVSHQTLFNNINEYLNVLQSVQLPFAMLPVLHFAASRDLMGRFASSKKLFAISACLALLVMSINVMLIVEFIGDPPTANVDDENPDPTPVWVLLLIVLVGIAYFGVCIRLVWDELLALGRYFTGRERQLSQTQITECMPAANDRTLCCAAPVY